MRAALKRDTTQPGGCYDPTGRESRPCLVRPSFSRHTVYQIRYDVPRELESNKCMVDRLARTYGLSRVEVQLLMGVDDAHIDLFGRISE